MLKLKQYFCRHDFKSFAEYKFTPMSLSKCAKCGVYCAHHHETGLKIKCKSPDLDAFKIKDN